MGSGSSKASSAGPSRVPANTQPLQREQKESTQPNKQAASAPNGQPNKQAASAPNGQPNKQAASAPNGQPNKQAASAPNGQPNRQPVSVSDQKENTNTTSNKQQISLAKNSNEVQNGRPSIIKEKSMQFNEARKRISSAVSRKANVQKKFSRGFSMSKIQARKEKCTDNPILLGDISKQFPPTAKIVRIFTSSTFTDTKYERNSWMVNSYPKIQSFCRDHGYDFQVVDMRWGIRDEATDDHNVIDICLRELEQCQKLSTGPNFVCLLSHKYGYRNLLKQIEAKEFEQLLPAITSAEDKDLLNKWYKRDDNAVPPVYVLQRISTFLPDFVSNIKADQEKAKDVWWTDSNKMHDLLAAAAEKCLGPEKSRNYLVSVTEREIQRGLLEVENQDTTCMWFKRNLLGIEDDKESKVLSKYIDFSEEEEKWKKSRQLLSELKDERMSKALPEKNIVTYNVKWISEGIDPKEHSQYLNKISEDLVTNMLQMIDTAIKAREKQELVEPILEECKQQIVFCQHKSNGFRGRDDILQKIKGYVTGHSQNPLVVHGSSGCGKTSIIAMAAKLTKTSWLKQAAVVCRFLGTTPDSSTIGPLLKSLILQIKKIYGQETGLSGVGIEDLKEDFVASLRLPFGNAPLIIFLDSLDQLDPANGARGVSWLPTEFSENVKIVVSTLVNRQYEVFPKLKAALPDDDSFIDVPVLSDKDAMSIINSWLESQHRTLTPTQNDIVVKAFNKCPLALYLKLSLDEACQWSSFSPPDQTVLQNTVRESINTLFHQLEVRYGNLFVSRTLGYLTVALNGLSESELEDILSCDDDVLNDVYQYWTPPTRRSPPLLLIRLKTDLDQYLVDRGADGMRVIYWYHRQFIEAAKDRYCTGENEKILHSALADFFAGIWSNGNKKPFVVIVKSKKTEGSEDRLVTAQPLMFKDKYNFRKLGHQPYHRIKAGQLDLVKSECLCNFNFLQTKLVAMTYRRVFMDLNLARNTFENDKELAWIADAFRLSEYALSHDPYQLAPHIIDRLSKEEVVSKFVEQCKQSDFPYLASSDAVLLKPGGELIYTMTGHTSSVKSLDVMADGSMAVTCGQYGDDVIRTWSLKKGKLVKEYENLPKDPEKVYFVDKDEKILIQYRSSVVVINISDNKQFTQKISHMSQLCVCGPNKSIFGTFLISDCSFFSVIDGTVKTKLAFDSSKNLFDIRSIISATTNYVALTHATEDEFYVINLVTKDLSISKRETSGKFSVDAIVITYSEKTVICASFLESTIRLHDINTLNIMKIIRTRDEPYEEISNFHVTKDGKCLYFPCYRDVIMIDLKNEQETKKFRSHPDSITDVQIFSNDKAVSITQDSIVRIWDMTESANTSETDCSLMDHRIVEFRPLPNCRHVVILGNPKATETDDYYMYVYDLVEKCIVQSTELDEGSHIVEAIDDNTVLVLPMSLKPKTIDLQTMTIKTVFQGKVCKRCKSYKMAKGGKEFMCLSRGRKNIKIYNTATGKVIKILKSPKEADYRIDSFFTNRDGSVIVAKADKTFIIFDVNDGKTTTVTASNLKMEIIGCVCSVSPNGNSVVLSACEEETTEVWDSEPMAFLWNVKKEKMAYQLIDSEYVMNYKNSDAPVTVALDEVRFLDDEKIVSSHDDFIIRVWSTETGGLLHRLTGHTKQAILSVPDVGPYFLSYGFMGEEVIKLWDRTNFQCIASFTLDTTVGKLRFCGDNETFVTSTENPVNLIHWSLHGRETVKSLHKYPELQRKNYNIQLEIEVEEDSLEDGDDPDTDFDELEESDDDSAILINSN